MVEQTLCPLSPELVSRDTDCAKAGPSLCECRLSSRRLPSRCLTHSNCSVDANELSWRRRRCAGIGSEAINPLHRFLLKTNLCLVSDGASSTRQPLSVHGTFRTWRDFRIESAFGGKKRKLDFEPAKGSFWRKAAGHERFRLVAERTLSQRWAEVAF